MSVIRARGYAVRKVRNAGTAQRRSPRWRARRIPIRRGAREGRCSTTPANRGEERSSMSRPSDPSASPGPTPTFPQELSPKRRIEKHDQKTGYLTNHRQTSAMLQQYRSNMMRPYPRQTELRRSRGLFRGPRQFASPRQSVGMVGHLRSNLLEWR